MRYVVNARLLLDIEENPTNGPVQSVQSPATVVVASTVKQFTDLLRMSTKIPPERIAKWLPYFSAMAAADPELMTTWLTRVLEGDLEATQRLMRVLLNQEDLDDEDNGSSGNGGSEPV